MSEIVALGAAARNAVGDAALVPAAALVLDLARHAVLAPERRA